MEKVVLTWGFGPLHELEIDEELKINTDTGYEITIREKEAIAEVPYEQYSEEINKELTESLRCYFEALMLEPDFNHVEFKIYEPSVKYPNGKIKFVQHIDAKLIVKYKADKKVSEKTKYRISKNAPLMKKFRNDKALETIMNSFKKANTDPENFFVHLFDIVEVLEKKFGCRRKMLSELNIPKKKIDILGRLCNDEPLKEGRHRGKNYDRLRKATYEERKEAKKIASEDIIEKYLDYLENLDKKK